MPKFSTTNKTYQHQIPFLFEKLRLDNLIKYSFYSRSLSLFCLIDTFHKVDTSINLRCIPCRIGARCLQKFQLTPSLKFHVPPETNIFSFPLKFRHPLNFNFLQPPNHLLLAPPNKRNSRSFKNEE